MTTKEQWKDAMPDGEKELSIGQRRLIFIDGLGELNCIIKAIHKETIDVHVEEDLSSKTFDFDGAPYDILGILSDGEEIERLRELWATEN